MKKRGVCINIGGCTKAKNREIQEAEHSDFVCAECGKPLREKNKRKRTWWEKILKYGLPVLAVLIGGGAGAYLLLGDSDPKAKKETTVVEEPKVQEPVAETTTVQPEPQQPVIQPAKPQPKAQPKQFDLGYAKYEGPKANGKPHGLGGELTITKHHVFDLKDGNGSTIEVNAGDVIRNCKFKNGKFVSGYLHRQDGTQTMINIGI